LLEIVQDASQITQSIQSTPTPFKFSKILTVALPRGFPNAPSVETSQETSSSFPLFENIQTLESVDPYDIIKEEKKKKSLKGSLSALEPDQPLAQPRLLPMYDGLIGELTLTTFEPIVFKPNAKMKSEDWRAT
jgi:hypothetical protein